MTMANPVLPSPRCSPVPGSNKEKFLFALNLHIYKAELFLRSSVGCGINDISPGLVKGPAPIGATLADLDKRTRNFFEESGLAGMDISGSDRSMAMANILLLKTPIPMPLLDVRPQAYAKYFDAINVTLKPPINVYADVNSFVVASVYAPYHINQYYAGIMPSISGHRERELAAGIALYEAASYGVLRSLLNDAANSTVPPYTSTVVNFTSLTAQMTYQLGGCGVKDEPLIVPPPLGAEKRTTTNVIAADANSLVYARTEREFLRILFRTGNATRPGGLFPCGFEGKLYHWILALKQS
ncbi:hypothetical protein V6N13_045340 [Hibiscus sabdariffa]